METKEKKSKKVGTQIPPELHTRLKTASAQAGISMQQAHIEAIENWLRSHETNKPIRK